MIKLKDHQFKALSELHNGCILCGGVGSGKSITSLGYFYLRSGGPLSALAGGTYRKLKEPIMDLYIITTARKRDSLEWDDELRRFCLSKYPENNLYKNKVVIDSWNNIKKYISVRNAFFIFDEQRVVGSGVWVSSFLKIVKSNQWILLSATPGDSWVDYIPVFIANGFYRNRTEFNQQHVIFKPFSNYPQIDRFVGTRRLERLRDKILVDMPFDRITTQHHEDVLVEYDRVLYRRISKDRWDIWNDQPIVNASGYCYALRKLVNSDDSRAVAVLEILEHHPKAIIFYKFDYEREILLGLGYPEGTEIAEWNGHKHQELPSSSAWVYLVQYTAGNEGWNCITTDTVIFYSQDYSYKVMEQAAGRIDRINTRYTDLWYYHLKSTASIDRAISMAISKKKNFNEQRFSYGKG